MLLLLYDVIVIIKLMICNQYEKKKNIDNKIIE